MMMDIIECPFCKGAPDNCEECDEEGEFELPDWAAYTVNLLTSLIKRAAHEEIGSMVIVIENHDGSVVESHRRGHTIREKGSKRLEEIAKASRKSWAKAKAKENKAKLESEWRVRIGRNAGGEFEKINDGNAENSAHLYYRGYDVRYSLCGSTLVSYGLSQMADEEDMKKRCKLCEKALENLSSEHK